MFKLQRLKNWTHSSVTDDKSELDAYQIFQDQFSSLNSKIEEYISELGYEDERLLIDYNGEKIPLETLKTLGKSILKDNSLNIQQRVLKSEELNRMYYEKLKELKDKITALAINETDNVYLAYINSCIHIINALLKRYAHLLAIQKSTISSIDNSDNLNAGEKIRVLKDNIDIRTSEINTRLSLENLKR